MTRFRPWMLAALVVLSLAVHSHFVIHGCGEQDEARLATDAIVWHRTGQLSPGFSDYRLWTSPLYLHGLKKALDWGVPPRALPDILNWSNVVFGTLTLIPMYLLLKRLANERAALAACALYSFAPAFWLANIYGMPHLPSFGLFLTALLLYARCLTPSLPKVPYSREPSGGVGFSLGSALAAMCCMATACALKLDMVLCGGAFIGVLVCQRRGSPCGCTNPPTSCGGQPRGLPLRVRNAAVGVGIVVMGVLLSLGYSRLLTPSAEALGESATRQFPLEAAALFSGENLLPVVMAFGPVLFGAALAALAWCGLAHRRLALLALLWGLPPLVHWGMKFGNSARHVLAPSLPLVLLVGVALVSLLRTPRKAYVALGMLVLANYAATGRSSDTVEPSSRIFESAGDIQGRISRLHASAREFVAARAEKKLLVGRWSNPYVLYEVVADARSIEVPATATSASGEMKVVTADGRTEQIAWVYVVGAPDVEALLARRRQGWLLWTMQPGIAKALEVRK